MGALLADSLHYAQEVDSLQDMANKALAHLNRFGFEYFRNVRIDKDIIKDNRLPPEWGGISYLVIADIPDGIYPIGYCNFYEE